MAYADIRSRNRRIATLSAVAVLHLGVIYALVTGLAATIIPIPKLPFIGEQIPITPPPPEKPRVQPQPSHPLTAIGPAQDPLPVNPVSQPLTPPTGLASDALGDDFGAGTGGGMALIPLDLPSPQSGFTPHAAAPLGKPGLWVTANDYPAADLRAEHAGITRFRLQVGADGSVVTCQITASSGWPGLDAATCNRLTRRARFAPATDETGMKVSGSYSSAVHWQIPE